MMMTDDDHRWVERLLHRRDEQIVQLGQQVTTLAEQLLALAEVVQDMEKP